MSSSGRITVARLADLAPSEIADVYQRVLQPAFRPDELMELDEVIEGYTGPEPPPNAVLMRDGQPLAVLLTEWYAERRVLLLAYVAVTQEARGQGAGSLLADQLAEQLRGLGHEPIAVAEVDDPRVWPGDASTGDAVARLRFYERRGARLVPVRYFQPGLRGREHRIPGMFLIRLDGVLQAAPDLLRDFLVEYFIACEGPEAVNDPDFIELLDQVIALDTHQPLPPLREWQNIPPP